MHAPAPPPNKRLPLVTVLRIVSKRTRNQTYFSPAIVLLLIVKFDQTRRQIKLDAKLDQTGALADAMAPQGRDVIDSIPYRHTKALAYKHPGFHDEGSVSMSSNSRWVSQLCY